MRVNANNYPANVGLNRRINGLPLGSAAGSTGSWQENGTCYTASTWDSAMYTRTPITLSTYVDGTSNTAIFSEWVKGPGQGSPTKNGLGMVYYPASGGLASNAFATDIQFNQACQININSNPNQVWNWKGEWAFSHSQIYSHTVMPNRYACSYADNDQEAERPRHADAHQRQLESPRWRQYAVHGWFGAVHQEHRELPAVLRDRDSGRRRDRQLGFVLICPRDIAREEGRRFRSSSLRLCPRIRDSGIREAVSIRLATWNEQNA